MLGKQDGEEGSQPAYFQPWVTIWFCMWLDCVRGDFALVNNQLTNLNRLVCVCVCVFVCFDFLVVPLSLSHTHTSRS